VFGICNYDQWYVIAEIMKQKCSIVTIGPIDEFARKLLNQKLINVIRIIYP
jgi:hypothetical protein